MGGEVPGKKYVLKPSRAEKVGRQYSILQTFCENCFGALSVHFPIWLPGTGDIDEAFLNANRIMAEAAGVQSGQMVLDAGCGIGGSAFWLAKNHGVRVIGISLSASNINRCRELAQEFHLDRQVSFETANFMSNDFEDETFDVVWNLESFSYANPQEAYVKRVHQILKPGGTWVCLDGFIDPKQCLDRKSRTSLDKVNDGFVHGDEDWIPTGLMQKYMAQSDFTDISADDITQSVLEAWKILSLNDFVKKAYRIADSFEDQDVYAECMRFTSAIVHSFRLMESGSKRYCLFKGKKPHRRED